NSGPKATTATCAPSRFAGSASRNRGPLSPLWKGTLSSSPSRGLFSLGLLLSGSAKLTEFVGPIHAFEGLPSVDDKGLTRGKGSPRRGQPHDAGGDLVRRPKPAQGDPADADRLRFGSTPQLR